MLGYHVLGIDYFFGDPIQNHDGEVGFNRTAWINKSRQQATDSLPKWTEQVKKDVGADAKFTAVGKSFQWLYWRILEKINEMDVIGYCFGAPYSMDASADPLFLASTSIGDDGGSLAY
jgi:hypothetical protein